MTTIGVLAVQGDFAEHAQALISLGATPREVRLPADLEGLDGLILPGGESTTFAHLMSEYGLIEPIRRFVQSGRPTWGTCAGLIALANTVEGRREPIIGVLDVSVERNAYGRQTESFEADLRIKELGSKPFRAVFIRAPVIRSVGPRAATLASYNGVAVAVQQGNILGTSFHPELTGDNRFHQYFLSLSVQKSHA